MITEVKSGTAYVNADPGSLTPSAPKLGWSDADQDDYPLERTAYTQ